MSLNDLIKKRVKAALKDLNSDDFKDEIGKFVTEGIRLRARVDGRAAKKRGETAGSIAELSTSYIEQRKRLRKRGILHRHTTPSKSNLTKTGAMLDSLHYTKAQGKVSVQVGSDQRKKAGYVAKAGRPFLNPSDLDLKEIRERIKARINKHFK